MNTSNFFRVRVVDISRNPLEGAEVRLSLEGSDPVDLKFDKNTGLYWTETNQRGTFVLSVSATPFESQERPVQLPHPPTPEEFVLGMEDMPFYYRGKVKTPFEPKPHLIGLTLPEDKEAASRVERVAAALGLVEEKTHEQVRANNVRVFRYSDDSTEADRQKAFDTLRAAPGVRLIGPVVEMFEQRLVFLTNQFVVKFSANVTNEHVQRIAKEYGFRVVRPIAAAGNGFLFEGEPKAAYSLLDVANALAMQKEVDYAEPNAVTTSMLFQVNPTDFLVAQQWHIPLINLPEAWQALRNNNAPGVVVGGPGDQTFGDENILIVVFDAGIQTTTAAGVATPVHPEFQGNVTSGAAKAAAFYDFVNMVSNNDAIVSDHGMGCAGVATALASNPSAVAGETEGVAGAAGNCRVIGARVPFGQANLRWADALVWMAGFNPGWVDDGTTYPVGTVFPIQLAQGVDIHTNSTRIPDVGLLDDTLDFLATHGRGGRGVVSFLAAGNTAAPISNPNNNTIADHDKVITVAASINTDVRSSYSCFDPAIDICAPSNGGAGQPAAPGKVTTDTVGGGNLAGHTGGPLNYRNNFGGTSSATPLAAGVGALMLSINPNLNWVQVREILRNSAEKIDAANTDPVGQWTTDAAGNPVFSQWYGFGRINSADAVTDAREFAMASDVVIRDNLADTGAVPSAGWHADSPDIWVRKTNDPIPVLAYTASPPHENPGRGQDNYVFLRVKNIGTAPTNEVYIRALITHFPGFEFRYPNEWQPSTPPSAPLPSPLVPGSYLIGSVLIDNLGPGADIIVKMQWDQSLVPPATVTVAGIPTTWHPCLLAEVSPHDGPGPSAVGTYDVKRYNDLAHKNITIDPEVFSGGFSAIAVVAGTALREGVRSLVIDRRMLTPDARVFIRIDDRDLMQRWLRLAKEGAVKPAADLPWRVERDTPKIPRQIIPGTHERVPGALTFLDPARVTVDLGTDEQLIIDAGIGTRVYRHMIVGRTDPAKVSAGRERGHDVVFFDSGGADSLELPLPLKGGEYVSLAIGIVHAGQRRLGMLRATQRLADGDFSPGYEVSW